MGMRELVRYYLLPVFFYSLSSIIKLDYCEQNKPGHSSKN